jgi:L-ascorbate metabolism protein UlaG (beta-lactamase superfamily)
VQIRWYGQSAFGISGSQSVFIDPFGSAIAGLAARGLRFDYPPIEGVEADLLLITHEHADHNGADAVGGSPALLRATAGTHESPLGEVVGVASEHDDVAGTQRGPNTIFCFSLDGLRLCHFGDFGQAALRPEQQAAIGEVDVLFLPVGDGPTVGGERAAAVVRALRPRLVVPCTTAPRRSASSTPRMPSSLRWARASSASRRASSPSSPCSGRARSRSWHCPQRRPPDDRQPAHASARGAKPARRRRPMSRSRRR